MERLFVHGTTMDSCVDEESRSAAEPKGVGLAHVAIGAVSVFKAVYIDRRELKCARVGGDGKVPLGFVSLTENLIMVGMAIWMILKPVGLGH